MTRARKNSQRGAALLIALFCLLLLSGIALGLITSTGEERTLSANYRASTQAFYASMSGLEEARGRLCGDNPNVFASTFISGALAPAQLRYILNPATGETVAPTTATNTYYDKWYKGEFGTDASAVASANVKTVTSVSGCAGCSPSLPGPLYKWVRITANTEKSSGIDVNGDGTLDSTTQLYYDGSNQNLTATGLPVYRLTALAVLPSGARRLLLYEVATVSLIPLNFPSALTLDGPNASYNGPNSAPFVVNGNDHAATSTGACGTANQASVPAIGDVTNAGNFFQYGNGGNNRSGNYTGAGASPSTANISAQLATSFQTVGGLDTLVSNIQAVANNVIAGPSGCMPAAAWGTLANPTITVITGQQNGNLTCAGNNTGYGILVVTGTLNFGGNTGWNGVVLVVGQGSITNAGGGNNSYNGAILVAKTRDVNGNLLGSLGSPSVNWSGGGGNGILYDTCWISKAANAGGSQLFKVLAFREVPQ